MVSKNFAKYSYIQNSSINLFGDLVNNSPGYCAFGGWLYGEGHELEAADELRWNGDAGGWLDGGICWLPTLVCCWGDRPIGPKNGSFCLDWLI